MNPAVERKVPQGHKTAIGPHATGRGANVQSRGWAAEPTDLCGGSDGEIWIAWHLALPPNEQTGLQTAGSLPTHKIGSAGTVLLDQSGQDKESMSMKTGQNIKDQNGIKNS